jgi:hypothetical protein
MCTKIALTIRRLPLLLNYGEPLKSVHDHDGPLCLVPFSLDPIISEEQ